MRRFLGKLPFFKRLMVTPPDEVVAIASPAESRWSQLVNQQGVTTTPLNPTGKAKFGDEIVDVVSEGEGIDTNAPIRVLEVLGNRIVVQAITSLGREG